MSLRIAVVCGGPGSENEVSRMSAANVVSALRSLGHACTTLEVDAELWPALTAGGYDCVFVAVHGRFGEDGTVQGICELLDLPYTGSGILATALCWDKAMAKRLFAAEGLSTPEWCLVEPVGDEAGKITAAMRAAASELGLPLVVKPRHGGSTIGLSIVRETGGLVRAHQTAAHHGEVLCERFVAGTEVTVGILGDNPPRALPTLEIVSRRPLYDYAAKYTAGQSQHIIPARLPEAERAACHDAALRAHRALGCRDMSRVDVIVDADGVPWVLEVNAIPGLTALSLLPDSARAGGVEFPVLCQGLVDAALARHRSAAR
ncbi:MAG TPA: D-alanine--D-alanine ligase [Candidatus Binatia bacterium]|nr:D-alanine--D-alanine ligase [Candidatus Binatia bacterium]